ncbi:choice-of-anchor J domain-containing protein, partial [Flavobacterium orientale]|uniref:choice-of-anchor J domain-containing protein n=1 Tax=Flavobacterium orientale TaxID=1756020 RepID=UPI001669276D
MKKITLLLVAAFCTLTGYSQYFEGFEGATFPPAGWLVTDNGVGTTFSWERTNNVTTPPTVYEGTFSAFMTRENIGIGNTSEDWLITNQLAVPANGQLRFFTRSTLGGNQGTLYQIRVSTSANQADLGAYTLLQQFTENELTEAFNVYEEKIISLNTFPANQQVFIAFVMVFTQPTTALGGDRWLVDNVSVVEQCIDPIDPTASNFSLTGATLSWGNPGGATQFEVEVVQVPNTPTGVGILTNSNPVTTEALGLTLQQATQYEFYVRAVCAFSSSLWVGPFIFSTAAPGQTCEAPAVISSLPYVTTDNTNNYGDEYGGTAGTGCGSGNPYLNGNDVFYSFTATSNVPVTITMSPTSNWSGLFVYNSCANVGVSCIAGVANSNTNPRVIILPVTAGQTYIIAISTWATGAPTQSTGYTLTIVENTCTNFTATYSVLPDCANGNQFFAVANVTNMGTATSVVGTSSEGGATQSVTEPGTMQFGPYPNGTNVTLNLQNANDVNCFSNSANLTQAFCPATNNLCSGAIPIECGDSETQTTVGATTAGAPTFTCGTGPGSGGLWYSHLGTGDIVTFSLCGSAFDTKIQVFTGSCGTFTCVAGNDDFCGNQSQVQIVTTPGVTYYVYVFGFGTAQGVFTLTTNCTPAPPTPINDNCDTATVVPVNTDATCALTVPGTINGATQSPQANTCVGTANDDVWFQFVATQASHTISLLNVAGSTTNLNHALFSTTNPSDPCAALTLVYCSDPNASFAAGLTPGNTYYIRIYSSGTAILQNTTFDVCVSVPPPPPVNDSCSTPLVAPVNSSLICADTISGTITSATASPEPNACTGTADDDVWFQFTALASIHNISFNNVQGTTTDLAFATYSGASCNALTQINCQVNNSGVVGGLTPGEVYYIRVYSQPATPNLIASFDLCITTPTQCDSAQLTCGDGSVINNQIGVPSYGSIGCLSTTPNPFWFTIEIETSGSITFTLNQTSAGNSDVDFILWGPFTSAQINSTACNNLYDYPDGNLSIPNNIVDCSYSAAATEFIDIPNAIQGQHYLLLVTNFGNSLGTFNINQTGGTGAAACCNVDLGPDLVFCNQDSHTINATFTGDPGTVIWYKDNVVIPNQTTASLTVTETGIYKCDIACGQTTKSDEVSITFNNIAADEKENVVVCDSYILPDDLSANNNYYTATGGPTGTGTMLNAGDVISTSQTIYIFAQTDTTPNCTDESSFEVQIIPTPVVVGPLNVVACDSYALPTILLGNYFTGPGGTGLLLNAGDLITTTQTIYIYTTNGPCATE